jgi:hypothetical protein
LALLVMSARLLALSSLWRTRWHPTYLPAGGGRGTKANAAYRLVRAASYDEALMLIRSIGEAANLLWVFFHNDLEFQAWKTADRKSRMKDFGPAAIRKKIEKITGMGFIEADRYQRLIYPSLFTPRQSSHPNSRRSRSQRWRLVLSMVPPTSPALRWQALSKASCRKAGAVPAAGQFAFFLSDEFELHTKTRSVHPPAMVSAS